jgi:fructan beta-fructosidase
MKKWICLYFVFLLSLDILAQDDQTPTPQWRPLYHFTPIKYWTNDPNGLIYLNKQYHMYNQQNPFENKWGHMSWGHAVSTDLVHWKHLPIAIPETIDKDTTWRFSGSVVWDGQNSSGFCKANGCLVAVYTADQPNLKKESQFIAFSNDGGMTYTNYDKNPVIDLQKKDFRDPNVSWSEQLNKWLMVVALPKEYKVRFYASVNLKDWELLSEFGAAGYSKAAWECPFLLPLDLEGGEHQKKWVLLVSSGGPKKGPFMQYFVGDFDGKTFKNDNPPDTVLTVDFGDCFYAAIPWNQLPIGQKTFIGWMVPGPQQTYPWKGQMSIPRDLSLRRTVSGIRLIQQPAALIRANLPNLSKGKFMEASGLVIAQGESTLFGQGGVSGNAYWVEAEITIETGMNAGFKIAGMKDAGHQMLEETIIGYDAASQELYVDRSHSGTGKINKDKTRQTIHIDHVESTLHLEILLDKSSLEVFANHGEYVLSTYVFPDAEANLISAFSERGPSTFKSVKLWDLSKINNDQ